MPPAPQDTPAPPPRLPALRILAVAITLVLAGCQSSGTQDSEPHHRTLTIAEPLDTQAAWLETPIESSIPQDIWERMRAGFQLQDHLDTHPRIDQQRLLLASRAHSIEQASARSAPYIHYIVESLEERDMPLELALLPIIESSYNPFAYSRAHAVGLWQFIPSTGQHFNLRQTSWYDGRRDITASTHAALRYLSYLHDLFNGDWLLALAAYNAGEGTVSRAIERNQRQGLPTDYWNLKLPGETQYYVPKLLALSQLVMSPENYGINLSPVANEPYFQAIALEHRLDLARVAKLAELDEDELYRLNPAFTRRITLDGPKQLLVPLANVELLEANLATIKREALVDWQQYKVRPGDTLGGIASRYNLSVKALKEINRLSSNRISIGQELSIPAGTPLQGEPLLRTLTSREVPATRYRVKAGDNLWDIARTHGLSVADLKRWNNLRGNSLRVGQALELRGVATANAASGKSAATYYKVRKGDSLYEIAQRFKVKLQHLQRWNPDSKVLRPGQTLTLYLP